MKKPTGPIRILALAVLTAVVAGHSVKAEEIRYDQPGAKEQEYSGLLSMEGIKTFIRDSIKEMEERVLGGTAYPTTYPAGQYPILGSSAVTVKQMTRYYEQCGGKYPAAALKKGGAGDIRTFCQIFYEEATAEGVKPEVAFAQAMKETGWLAYGGDATVEQYNFAGLGTTGGGVKGNAYPDVRTGIRAQIQHLKAYATDAGLNQTCVDDRYTYVKKGCAPYVELLGQQENPSGTGWATAQNYGYDIVDMITIMRTL